MPSIRRQCEASDSGCDHLLIHESLVSRGAKAHFTMFCPFSSMTHHCMGSVWLIQGGVFNIPPTWVFVERKKTCVPVNEGCKCLVDLLVDGYLCLLGLD